MSMWLMEGGISQQTKEHSGYESGFSNQIYVQILLVSLSS